MKPLIQLRTTNSPIVIAFLLACFAVHPGPKALGLVPPPDGGYPNFTTAEGQNALFSLTTGAGNTGLGWFSLKSATTGSFNTGVGAGTLVLNTGDENTAIGTAALLLNTATGNTALGSRALLNNTTGGTLGNIQGLNIGPNVAIGQQALESNTIAGANTAAGYQALHSFTTGPMGFEQLGLCTAVGFQALANTTTGFGNSGFGYQALFNNIDGAANTAIGLQALLNNTSGTSNVANGNNALLNNTSGGTNTAIGVSAMEANINGNDNTAIGWGALRNFNLGVGNTAVGSGAGSNSTGNDNTFLGANAGTAVGTATNVICIGANVAGEDSNGSCYIGFIFGSTVSGGAAVSVNSLGKLGTVPSSRRFKDDITAMDGSSEAIYALKPVTFRYKKEIDPGGTSQLGLVAEDVEKVNPDLVVRDKEGKPYSVRYDQVNAMLLNEFLKEHRTVQELKFNAAKQEATIAHLQKQVAELAAGLQKVSAHLELSKPAPQTVLNSH